MSNSIQFNSDGSVFSNDGRAINKTVNTPGNVVHDSQNANVGISINQSDFASYQQHTGAQQGTSSTRVQLHQDDGLVRVAGFEAKPEVAERLKIAAPDLFVTDEAKTQEAAKASDAARKDEATREELGRHQDDTLEAYHQHLVGEVSTQNLIGLLVYGQKAEAPSEALLSEHRQRNGRAD